MVKRRHLYAPMLAVLLVAGTAIGDDDTVRLRPGMMGVADIGAEPCSLFNEMHYNGPAGMEHHVLTWVQGYVHATTGANIDALLAAAPDGHGWNFDSLSGYFVDYCRDNPDAPVSDAAIALAQRLTAGDPAPAD